MPPDTLADPAVFSFVLIPLALAAALGWGVYTASRALGEAERTRRRAVLFTVGAAAAWMGGSWLAADTGVLRRWDAVPPPFGLLVVGIVALASLMSFSSYGARLARGLPIWLLVAVQGFRFPLELAMHVMYERGIMPVHMSYSGRNFDILTGISAFAVAWLAATGRAGRGLVLAWNVVGLALLINVVTVAILATPRFRYFGDDHLNVWITYPPFVWLPAVMVPAAFAGHLIIFRAVGRQTI